MYNVVVMVEDYTLWHIGQIKFLLKLVDSPDNTAMAESKSQGGSCKELKRKGYVVAFGKIGRSIRWKLIKPISKKEVDQLRKMAEL